MSHCTEGIRSVKMANPFSVCSPLTVDQRSIDTMQIRDSMQCSQLLDYTRTFVRVQHSVSELLLN